MKKLNRKGFTLVELLAVIIILAIVVGITIPAVLTTTSNAKVKAFETAATSAADWIDRQYQVLITGLDTGNPSTSVATLDGSFKTACVTSGALNADCKKGTTKVFASTDDTAAALIASAGLQTNNITSMKIEIDTTTGRSCVTLVGKNDYSGTKTGGSC